MALLVAPRGASAGVRGAMARCGVPLGFLAVGLRGEVERIWWNGSAGRVGLEGVGVGVRWKGGEGREAVLTWEGGVWERRAGEDDGDGG